ncbi:MAG: NAD-dependent epimerase/dehydratase family protein [Patescibacteria group bacterium]
MKIIVTGGAGFIASHIVDAYLKAGHKVVVIDDLSYGFRRNLNPQAKFYKADIGDRKSMDKIFRTERPDVVNHHAARASVIESVRDPAATINTNLMGTLNLLLAFGKYRRGTGKFIFASTGGAIYGSPQKLPAGENTPQNLLSPYALSKALGEELIRFYAAQFKFPYLLLRYANVYGPRQNPKGEAGVVAIFSGLIKHNRRPVVFGDGSKTRDYVHVDDVMRANVLGLGRGKNECINIGLGREISDEKVFRTVAGALGFKKEAIYARFRTGEVRRISLDARRARRVLGWKPKIKFEEGIRRTVNF